MGKKWQYFKEHIIGLIPENDNISNEFDKLVYSINVTAKSRFNASLRVKRTSKITFFTSTVFSLGIILISIIQNSDIQIKYSTKTLNMMLIFLSVLVLVYTIIITTEKYDFKYDRLDNCGNKLKELARKMSKIAEDKKVIEYDKYLEQYNIISRDSENHTRNDYRYAKLQMQRYYKIHGFKRIFYYIIYYIYDFIIINLVSYIFIIVEVIFILKMIGIM